MSQFLSYGDYIFLTFPQKKENSAYYLHGKSILDPKLSSVSSKDLLKKGFRNCIFQIFPRNCQYLIDNLYENQNSVENFQTEWKALLQEEIQRHLGSPVLYGDYVHLLHLETRSFLSYEANKTENSIPTSRLYLVQDISQEKTCFQFETVSNYYYPGEKICYKTNILVKHATTSQYLTYITEDADSSKSESSESSLMTGPVMELSMNPLPITMIQVTKYSDPKTSKDFRDANQILNGDFVRIYDLRLVRENLEVHKFYLEQKDDDDEEKRDDLVLNYYNANLPSTNKKSATTSNSLSALNIFQIINPEEIHKAESSINLFPKSSEEGNINYKTLKTSYFIKHLISSSYVMNPTLGQTHSPMKLDLKSKEEIEDLSKYRVNLFKLGGREGSLLINSNFLIGDYSLSKGEILFVAQSAEEDPERVVKTIAHVDRNSNPEQNVMYYKDERLLAENYNTFSLQWDRESNLSESLRCEKVTGDELYNLNFFLSSCEVLEDLNSELEDLRKNKIKEIPNCFTQVLQTVEKIKDLIVKILLFVTDKKLDGRYTHDDKFAPSILKQNYLRELKVIESLNGIILKLTLVDNHYQDLPITKDKKFEELISHFTYLLRLYMLNNPVNINDLMRSVKIYLRSELMQRLTNIVTEVLNHSEFASLNLIMEILKLFIYDKSSNNYTNYSPHSELSVKILKILFAASKFKSFCIALQRYRKFWSPKFISSVFPKLVMNKKTNVLEVHYKDTHLMNLVDIKSETNLPLEADYVLSSFKLITTLAKKLPNFQRLHEALQDFIPYEACLEVIQFVEKTETYSFTTKKLMLDLIIHFHFKYFLSQGLYWPYQFIRACNASLSVFNDMEILDYMIQSTNALPQKLVLVNIYNLYNKKLRNLLGDNFAQNKDVLNEIYEILQFCSIFFQNDIIEFPDKKPFLILYHGYSELNKDLDQHVSKAKKISPAESSMVSKIRSQFKEIQRSINQAIETFFAKEYLLFLKFKYSTHDHKTSLEHLHSALTSYTRASENQSLTPISKRTSEKNRLLASRRSSVGSYIDAPKSATEDFIEIKLDNYKYEEDLKAFLAAWDESLEMYSLSLKKIVTDQLGYIEESKMEVSDIISLEKLASRFKSLVKQLKNFVILENNAEIVEIIKLYTSLTGVTEMIEGFAKTNGIGVELFDNAERELEKSLELLGIDTKVIKEADINSDNILNFLLENQHIFDINYQILNFGKAETSRLKFQDSMRILKIYEGLLDTLDYFVTSTNEHFMPRTLKCRLYVVQILLYFILNHSANCQALHKLLVTAYFYEVYSGKVYSVDVVVYMQILLSNLFKYSPELLRNDHEIKRLFQIFYEPYLRNIIDLNYRGANSPLGSPLKSPKSVKSLFSNFSAKSPRKSPQKDVSHLLGSFANASYPQILINGIVPTSSENPLSQSQNIPSSKTIPHIPLIQNPSLGRTSSGPPNMSQSQTLTPKNNPPTTNVGQILGVGLRLQNPMVSPDSSSSGNFTFNMNLINMRTSSTTMIKMPANQDYSPQMERLTTVKYQALLIMCSFTLNSIQAFYKTSSRPLLAKFQGHLQDLFYLNSDVFGNFITNTPKYKFDNEELKSVWLRFYQNLLRSCTEFASTSPVMQDYLLKSFRELSTLNNFILRVNKSHPYGLKAELMQMGALLFSSFEGTEENSRSKIEFLFISLYETLLYIEYQLSKAKENEELQQRPGLAKIKNLKVWEDINRRYGIDLMAELEKSANTEEQIAELEKIQIPLQQNVFGNILKFFKHLFKYHTPFCMTLIPIRNSDEKAPVVETLMSSLSELLEASKFHGQQEKVSQIRNNLLNEVKNNKDFGKFHHQMKVIDFLLTFESPALAALEGNPSLTAQASVAVIFDQTIEKFLSEENIKSLENSSLALLVETIEQDPNSEKILKQILSVVQSGLYSELSQDINAFFSLLLRDLLKNKILTLEEKVTEFQYRIPHIKLVQRLFSQYNFAEFLFDSMVECHEDHLLIFLEMANLLLYGGYDKIQKSFYDCFMSDQENRLMLKLSAQLKKISERFHRKEKIRNTANQMLFIRKKLKNDHLKHKEDSDSLLLSNLLRFISLLCENHNRDFQQFFKEQNHENKLNSISINFPIELCLFINTYVDICNFYSYQIGHQLFAALIEIVQGNSRDIIFEICHRTTIINDILHLLTKYQPGTDLYKGRRFEGNNYMESLKSDAINLLLSIAESSNSDTKQIIAEEINYQLLIKATVNYINDYLKKHKLDLDKCIEKLLKTQDEVFVGQGGLGDGLNLLIVIKVLQRSCSLFKNEMANKIQECDEKLREDFELYMEKLGGTFIRSIEIVDQNKNLRKIYFSQLPSCFHLDQEIKDDVIERIDRTAYYVKISEFMDDSGEVHYKMKSQMDIAINPKLAKLTSLYPKMKSYSYKLAYIINSLILLYFQNEDLDIIYADTYSSLNSYFYVFLNFIQLVFSLSMLVFWFGTNEPKFHLMAKWTSFRRANAKKIKHITYEEEQKWHLRPDSITIDDYIRILKLKGPNTQELRDPITRGLAIPEVQYEYLKCTIKFLLKSPTFINNLTYVINCWLSLVVHPIFCSLQLLNSLAESKIMQSVIVSFSKNLREIGITMGGSVIIVFIYSLIGFFFLRDSFVVDDHENVCTSIWHCFISLLNYGMRSGGGIGDVLSMESYTQGDKKMYTARWFYDISFFFIIIVVLLNLIFGIVIDTFGDIRGEKIENQKDQTGKCFICDIDRGMLERVGSGFEEHTANEHHMWNYIFYIVHIRVKGVINLSENENYVYNCFKNKDYSWIPYKKALCMHGKVGEDEMENDIDFIKERILKMESKMDLMMSELLEKKEKKNGSQKDSPLHLN